MLGVNEQHTYKKVGLKSFLQFHHMGEGSSILNGVLDLNNKNQIMTPLKVCSASHDAIFRSKIHHHQDTVILSTHTILNYSNVDSIHVFEHLVLR